MSLFPCCFGYKCPVAAAKNLRFCPKLSHLWIGFPYFHMQPCGNKTMASDRQRRVDQHITVCTEQLCLACYSLHRCETVANSNRGVHHSSQQHYFWNCFVLFFFLGEKPTLFVLLSSVLCITGIISVIQPDFIFNLGNQNKIQEIDGINGTNGTSGAELNEGEGVNSAQVVFKYLIAVVSGVTYCADIVILKKRPYLNDHMTAVLFWSFLSNTALSVIIMLIFETPCLPTGSYDILNIVLHCLCFAILWPFYMYAVKYISGNTCNIIFSMNVVLMLIAQYTILSSILPGKRNWIEVLGVVLVLSGSTLTSVMEICQQLWK